MRYTFLLLFFVLGMGCQTMKAKKQAGKKWKRIDKEWFSQQSQVPVPKTTDAKREVAQIQTKESRSRTEPNYSEEELRRQTEGANKLNEYCTRFSIRTSIKEYCRQMYHFIKYIEPELFVLCFETHRSEKGFLNCWNLMANKIYTQQEIEDCKNPSDSILRLFPGNQKSKLERAINYCVKNSGVFIRPVVKLSQQEKEECNRQLSQGILLEIKYPIWYEDSFGKFPVSGGCNIFGCSQFGGCTIYGCPSYYHEHCYATGEGCHQGPRYLCR